MLNRVLGADALVEVSEVSMAGCFVLHVRDIYAIPYVFMRGLERKAITET